MTVRKIDLMHRQFGKMEGKQCRDCSNLYKRSWDKTYYKCSVYGKSQSDATDWRLKYPACGMFNKEWNGSEIVRLVNTSDNRSEEPELLEGQYYMEEL